MLSQRCSEGLNQWVIPSSSVEGNRYYSAGQHRGNVGEGQLHIKQNNIGEFNDYLVTSTDLRKAIQKAYVLELTMRAKEVEE